MWVWASDTFSVSVCLHKSLRGKTCGGENTGCKTGECSRQSMNFRVNRTDSGVAPHLRGSTFL